MRKFQFLIFLLKRSYICYYITVPLSEKIFFFPFKAQMTGFENEKKNVIWCDRSNCYMLVKFKLWNVDFEIFTTTLKRN